MALLSVDAGDCLIVRLVVGRVTSSLTASLWLQGNHHFFNFRRFVTDGIAEKWRAHPAVRHERARSSTECEIGISYEVS
eukprot:scaffold2949_cov92-Skeletonema_dohrnii-CCMP3373.AAC.3